jgi:hypothetical protein
MRSLKFVLAAVAVMAAIPASAHAQSVSGHFKWAGTGNSFGWWWRDGGGTNHNYYGGAAYRAQFQNNGTWSPAWQWPASAAPSGFGPAVDIYCVDFLHNANTSSTGYNAYFTKLTAASFAGSYTTRSNDLTRYLKAAWLVTKMNTYGTSTTADKVARGDIHAAIWWIMSGQPAGGSYQGSGSASLASNYSTTGMNSWIGLANANYTSVNGMEWTVVTDSRCTNTMGTGISANGDGCSQEFLTQNVVPEPATMILLGTGLLATLAAAGVLRRPEA